MSGTGRPSRVACHPGPKGFLISTTPGDRASTRTVPTPGPSSRYTAVPADAPALAAEAGGPEGPSPGSVSRTTCADGSNEVEATSLRAASGDRATRHEPMSVARAGAFVTSNSPQAPSRATSAVDGVCGPVLIGAISHRIWSKSRAWAETGRMKNEAL